MLLQSVGRLENAVGWYHSHPGYGCWLSGIDCSTQMTQQQYNEPFLAIVVDPHRTIAAGKVEIGAFRTYPEVTPQPVPPRGTALSNHLITCFEHTKTLSRGSDDAASSWKTRVDDPVLMPLHAGLQAAQRAGQRVPDHPDEQDRGLWRARQPVLPAGRVLLQVQPGLAHAGHALEQVRPLSASTFSIWLTSSMALTERRCCGASLLLLSHAQLQGRPSAGTG